MEELTSIEDLIDCYRPHPFSGYHCAYLISEQKYQEELELFFKRVKLNVAEDLIKEGAASKLELLRLKQDSAIEKYDKSQREMSYKMFIPFYDDEKK